MNLDLMGLIEVGATVAGATATVIGLISKPLWKKLTTMETTLDGKLDSIGKNVEGLKNRVGEQNGRLGKIETWAHMHEQHDDERHRRNEETRKELLEAIQDVREQLE